MDTNKTKSREANGKAEVPLEPECSEGNTGGNDVMCPSKNSPPKNGQSENGKQSRNSFIRKLTFRRSMGKLERRSTEESTISRFSRNFSLRKIKGKEDGDRASKEIDCIPRNPVDCEGEDYVYKEPISVMQIHQLIQKGQLLEAFRNIKALEKELLAAKDAKKFDDNPKEYIVRAKDVNMLYDSISKEIQRIVEETLDLPKGDTQVLTSLVALIEEEETHAEAANISVPSEPASCLGLARNWRELWKKTVAESVKERVLKVPMPFKEDNSAWLEIHLEHLKSGITQDLLTVKHWVQKSFPQHYNVCDTYLNAFHGALSFHLQGILEENSGLGYNEYYTMLDWVINRYSSEVFLGHPDLKPEMKTEELPSLLTPRLLAKLKNDCVNSVKQKTRYFLENILMLETKEKWESEEQPDAPQSQYHSFLSLDIQTLIGEHMKTSGNISKKLETAVLEVNLKELIEFIPHFGKAFLEWDKAKDPPQSVSFMVTYMNSFLDLRMGLQENLKVTCKELEKTLANEMLGWRKYFLNKLRLKTKPMFKKILSQEWISTGATLDSVIMQMLLMVELFSKQLSHLKSSMCTDFLNEVHKYVVKEYITQTLKSKGRIKRSKRKDISRIMAQDATAIHNTMRHLGSSFDWLQLAIPYIANIIGEKKKNKIKDYIAHLSYNYPDIRKEHILAILALRGLSRNKRNSIVDSMAMEELQVECNRTLFAEIELQTTFQCF